MAYRITATTEPDLALLDQIRDLAWRRHETISQVIREAFELGLLEIPIDYPPAPVS